MPSDNNDYDSEDHEFARRMRKNVLTYPDIRDLFYLLVFPLLRDKPHRISADAWLEQMWNVAKYPIKKFKAINNIHIPGAFWLTPEKRQKGCGPRFIKNGQELICRFDLVHMTVDIETLDKGQNKYCTYTLSVLEWDSIVKRLKEINNE